MAGGVSAKICASRTACSMPVARFDTASAVLSLPGRWSQSLNSTNAMPEFWPAPMNDQPAIVKIDSTVFFSFSR